MGPNNSMDPITLAAAQTVPVIGNSSKATGAADGQFQKLLDQYASPADKPAQTPSASDKPQYAAGEDRDTTDQTTAAAEQPKAQEEAPKTEDDPLEQMKKLAEYGYVLSRPDGSVGVLTLNGQVYQNDEYYIGWKGDKCVVIPDSGLDSQQLGEILNGSEQLFTGTDDLSGVLEAPMDPENPGVPLTDAQMAGEPVTENVDAILAKTSAAAAPAAQEAQSTPTVKKEEDDTEVKVTGHENVQTVFRSLQSAPIKVGESFSAERTETEDVSSQLARQIIPAMEQGQTKVELQLTPETLGSVKVEITQSENGALHVAISAQNSEARNLLARNADSLQSLLAARSQAPVQVEVQRQEESQQPQQQNYDGHNGAPSQQQQQQRQPEHAKSGEDFLHQLRLGLVDEVEDEI